MEEHDFALQRRNMVEMQIMRRGIKDEATLASLLEVPRHSFVPPTHHADAYADYPIHIGKGQTISQPYIVALMTQAAECDARSRVLEIGTGSGYAAAVFSRIVEEVYTVERIASLAEEAMQRFKELGYTNIHVNIGDGTLGWLKHAPYDAIVVTAGAPVPPESLIAQLKVGGRLIIPVGNTRLQSLMRYRKTSEKSYSSETLKSVRFVPLIGEEGWHFSNSP